MKHLVGKTVFLTPTGNNVPRHKGADPRKPTAAIVLKVMVKYMILGFENPLTQRIREKKVRYKFGSRYVQESDNSGYRVFESLQDLEEFYYRADLIAEVGDMLNHYNKGLRKLSNSTLELIKKEASP